jgi:ubiquinone biosynthesis protein
MIYFLFRLIIYTVAAALVMRFVPSLRLAPYPYLAEPYNSVLSYVVIGMVFGALHSFVRPVILFLTGRLYVWSMGLLALVTDIFLFLVTSYLAPTVWQSGDTRIVSATLGAIIMGVTVMLLEAIFGFDSPRISNIQNSPFYWRWLAFVPSGRRNRIVESLRTHQMVHTIRSYIIDIVVGLSPLRGFRQFMQRILYRWRPRLIEDNPAVKLRLMLQDLGPTFVKFGQMAASRVDLLPATWRVELERLQDNVPPFPYSEVRQQIEQELGQPLEVLFAHFDPTPLAAASMGQVHAALLPSGEAVVVKVRRPNIDVTVRGDLNVMHDVLHTAEQRVAWLRQFGLSSLFREFAEHMLTELDYANEAYHARLLRHNLQPIEQVYVPLIYGSHSTKLILTQERVRGVKISDQAALDAAQVNHEAIGRLFFRALLKQLLFDGFFHADLHPGNVWIEPQTQQIIFLDMGMVGHLTRAERLAFGQLIWALQDHDSQLTTRIMLQICKPAQGYDRAALAYDIECMINQYIVLADATPDMNRLLSEMLGLLMRYGLQLRKEFTLAFKAIGQGEAIMRGLMGNKPLDYILQVSYTTMRELLQEYLAPQHAFDRIAKPLSRDIIGRLPALLGAGTTLLDDLQQGQSIFQIRLSSVEQHLAQLQRNLTQGIRRIVLSVALVGLLLGSALTLLIPLDLQMSDFERIAIRGTAASTFVISVALSLGWVFFMLWQSLRDRT